MNINEVRSLKYREIVHHPHPVFKGTCVHWRVNGEIVEYKRSKLFRLPLKYCYYVYSEINNHNFETFHRACDCPNSNSYFNAQRAKLTKEQKKQLTSFICGHCGKEKPTELGLCSSCGRFPTQQQQTLPFSEEEKKRKGVSLT